MMSTPSRSRALRFALLGATMLGGLSANQVLAQTTPAPQASTAPAQAAPGPDDSTVVVVTGFRRSLLNATKAKKNSTNFTESVFAEDMGKFPDLNLAESLQRVPGVVLQRDPTTGTGTEISVRALPPSFTNVTLNGSRFEVASDGSILGGAADRETDLDLFPSELFTRIDVSKTPSADQPEGGIAGIVNLQNARPFDHKGFAASASLQGDYNSVSQKDSPREALVVSDNWDGKYGVLFGIANQDLKIRSDGFQTVGWTDPNISNYCGTCDPSLSNSRTGSNGFSFANVVPANAGNGLVSGSTLSETQLLALNPGLTQAQLEGALLPRLPANYYLDGDEKRTTGVLSFEWRPEDNLRFALDMMAGTQSHHLTEGDMDWYVRNSSQAATGGMVPLNMQVDSNDVVTSATFANSAFILQGQDETDKTSFVNFDPTFVWDVTDKLKVDGGIAYTRSTFYRDLPSFLFNTPYQSGLTVKYSDNGGNDIPTVSPSVNLNSPNLGWQLYRMNIQNVKRLTYTKSAHVNFDYDWGDFQLKAGAEYDQDFRNITAYDNSANYQAAFAAAIPNSQIGNYLLPGNLKSYMSGVSGIGYGNFVVPNFQAIENATNFNYYNNTAPISLSSASATPSGQIDEKMSASYIEYIDKGSIFGVPVSSNGGFRFISTDQIVTAPSTINGAIVFSTTEHKYQDVLPSFNAVANITPQFNLRVAASKTMTRPNPDYLLPQTTYSDPAAQVATSGNPNLKPYYSDNYDFGGEYYTGGLGYVGLTLFEKKITGFTQSKTDLVPFNDLGIAFSSLSITQQQAITNGGGQNTWNVFVTQQVNSTSVLKLDGLEFMWVQPLDILWKGLGYTFNFTDFDDHHTTLATGIPSYTYNLTAYYETGPWSTHLSYVKTGNSSVNLAAVGASPNGVALNEVNQERYQIDFSGSYDIKTWGHDSKITLDVTNLTKQGFRTIYQYSNVVYSYYNPGLQMIVGWQGSF